MPAARPKLRARAATAAAAALLMVSVSPPARMDAPPPMRLPPARPAAPIPLATTTPTAPTAKPAPAPAHATVAAATVAPATIAATAKPAAKPPKPPAPATPPAADYIDAITFGRALGLKATWRTPREELALHDDKLLIVLRHDSRELSINSMRVFTGDAVRGHRGTLRVSRTDADTVLTPLINATRINTRRINTGGRAPPPPPAPRTIVIDPGHGGSDHGKINDKLKLNEKTLTLDTALRLKTILEARGYRIVMTRTADVKVELPARAVLATTARADLFVSIHFNSVAQGTQRVRGLEVYRFTPRGQAPVTRGDVTPEDCEKNPADSNACWNTLAAYHMQRSLLDGLKLVDRGLKHHKFAVLRLAPCPALLLEGGFLSNDTEAKLIATPGFRQKLAQSIADGIDQYAEALAKTKE